jgi:peptidoglycan hydrolase CwlO-like protein
MRNKKSQVIVYDMVHRQWRGCDWVPPEDEDRVSLLLRMVNDLKRDVAYLKTSVKKHERLIGQLEKKRSSKRGGDEEPEPEPEPAIDPEVMEAEKRASEARKAMQKARETIEDDEWFKSMRAALAEGDTASSPSAPPQ